MSRKIKIDLTTILTLFPEAIKIYYLPRKKKKELKKNISKSIIDILREVAVKTTDDYRIFEQTDLSKKFELEGKELEEFNTKMLKSYTNKKDQMDNAIGSKEKGKIIKEKIDSLLKK